MLTYITKTRQIPNKQKTLTYIFPVNYIRTISLSKLSEFTGQGHKQNCLGRMRQFYKPGHTSVLFPRIGEQKDVPPQRDV